jgi:spore coat polysaccharide biosynthesis protein SpsF
VSSENLKTESAWAGAFGQDYTARNVASDDALRMRTAMWGTIGRAFHDEPPRSILEVGCNLGLNLRVLPRLFDAELSAIEPNPKAREILLEQGVLPPERLHAGFGDEIPLPDGAVELAFTTGVLIHVAPEKLNATIDEIHRVSSKYVMCAEYFSPRPETLSYRGEEGLLFKNDFGGCYLDRFPDLQLVDYGFFWKRATGLDDATWWLFRKR